MLRVVNPVLLTGVLLPGMAGAKNKEVKRDVRHKSGESGGEIGGVGGPGEGA